MVYSGVEIERSKFNSTNDALLDKLQGFIRAGIKEGIDEILDQQKNVIDIVNTRFEIRINVNKFQNRQDTEKDNLFSGDQHYSPVTGHCTLKVTALQLALLGRQLSSVEAILSHKLNRDTDDDAVKVENILGILRSRVLLQFEGDSKESYDMRDRILAGMNAFHLSSYYHPEGLQKILEMLNDLKPHVKNKIGPEITELLNDQGNHYNYSPLHIATKKSVPHSVR